MTERKRKPRMGAPRTEVFAMRLDPKLKYLAEIAARKQRRSLANFVEWAVENALENVKLTQHSTVAQESTRLWELDAPGRLVRLANNYPWLLTYDEQCLWQALKRMWFDFKSKEIEAGDLHDIDTVDIDFVRNNWERLLERRATSGLHFNNRLDAVLEPEDDTTP